MTPAALPLIVEADFPHFQRLLPELAQTSYQEWEEDHRKAQAYRRTRNGSREIPISPDVFDRWLKDRGLSAHLELLWECVEEMAHLVPADTAKMAL